jgi:hypothetical protein
MKLHNNMARMHLITTKVLNPNKRMVQRVLALPLQAAQLEDMQLTKWAAGS